MLRSPTHNIVGHGPTSSQQHATTTTTTNPLNNHHHHHHHHLNNHHHHHNNNNNHHLQHNHYNQHPRLNGTTTTTTNHSTTITTTTNNSSLNTNDSGVGLTPTNPTTRTSLFDSCHRKIRLIGGGPVAFLGGLVAKARRKERDGDQNSTDTKLYLEESVLERKLPDADLKALVDLPAGLDYNEWLASHTLALFEHVNLVYGTISEFCTTSGCPDMTGPGNRTYLWFDEKGKKTRVAAPQYIDYVMTFTQKTVSDESIFPTKYANEFPSSFESIARKILRWQFHVIAHLYAAHFREIALLGLHTHLNLTFAHLTALHRRFNLIDEKETDVLRDLEVALRLTDDGTGFPNSTPNTTSSTSQLDGNNCGGSSGINTSTSNNSGGGTAGRLLHGLTGSNEDSSLLNSGIAGRIDGDSSIQPICTQPEAMKGLGSDQGDLRIGGGGGDTGGYFKGGIGGGGGGGNGFSHVMNFNNNVHGNSAVHHHDTATTLTANSLLQCNNSSRSTNNSPHTSTTA